MLPFDDFAIVIILQETDLVNLVEVLIDVRFVIDMNLHLVYREGRDRPQFLRGLSRLHYHGDVFRDYHVD